MRFDIGQLEYHIEQLDTCDEQYLEMYMDYVTDIISLLRVDEILSIPYIPSPQFYCYECAKPYNYLFDDGRCSRCTQLTPDEVQGIGAYDA